MEIVVVQVGFPNTGEFCEWFPPPNRHRRSARRATGDRRTGRGQDQQSGRPTPCACARGVAWFRWVRTGTRREYFRAAFLRLGSGVGRHARTVVRDLSASPPRAGGG